MAKTETHIPKLRFKGFSGEWSNEKLGKVTNYMKGFAFSANLYQSKGIQVIRVSDLGINSIVEKGAQVFIDRSLIDTYKNYIINKNDILITTVGSKSELQDSAVGRAIFIKNDIDGLLNQNLVKITGNGVSSSFLYCLFLQKKYRDHIAMIERGNANQANITIADLWEYKFQKPEYKEQTQIGNFFQKIDQVIELQQKALDTARDYKKSMLQKMFPQKGEKVPQIRFDGFSGDWEDFCLDEIAYNFNGLSGKTKEYFGLGFPFITYKQVFANSGIKNFTDCELVEINANEKQSLVQYGDVFFTTSSETPEEVGFSSVLLINPKRNTYLNSFCFGVRVRNLDDLAPTFAQYLFRSPLSRKTIEILAQGSTRFNISKTNFMKLIFFKPKLNEQKKIGEFFQKLDQRIEQHEKKLQSYQNLKKAMLQRLFV